MAYITRAFCANPSGQQCTCTTNSIPRQDERVGSNCDAYADAGKPGKSIHGGYEGLRPLCLSHATHTISATCILTHVIYM